jgi:flagella basal body P-ring formation protein FlgA
MLMRSPFKILAFAVTGLVAFLARSIAAPENATTAMPAPFSQENLVGDLSRDLSAHYNLEGDLQLELLRAWNSPDRVACNWQVQVLEYPTLPASSMLLRCRVLADGNPIGETTFVLRASLWREVWIARQPLTNGAVFDPALLDTRRVDFFRERDVVPATVGDRTFIFNRSVQAGRSLTWRDIGRRPLVRKGDVVDVSASDGMLSISMKALAMQNGAQGEAVTVRNLESRKDFTAFVVDENRVQVRF